MDDVNDRTSLYQERSLDVLAQLSWSAQRELKQYLSHATLTGPLMLIICALIYHSVNVELHKSEQKMLLSGLHTISNITCKGCHTPLGWVYLKASDPAQRYKEGMSCLRINVYHVEGSLELTLLLTTANVHRKVHYGERQDNEGN